MTHIKKLAIILLGCAILSLITPYNAAYDKKAQIKIAQEFATKYKTPMVVVIIPEGYKARFGVYVKSLKQYDERNVIKELNP